MRLPLGNRENQVGHMDLFRSFDAGPLQFDVNYLTTVFQPAVARSAERIFETAAESTPRHLAAGAK